MSNEKFEKESKTIFTMGTLEPFVFYSSYSVDTYCMSTPLLLFLDCPDSRTLPRLQGYPSGNIPAVPLADRIVFGLCQARLLWYVRRQRGCPFTLTLKP